MFLTASLLALLLKASFRIFSQSTAFQSLATSRILTQVPTVDVEHVCEPIFGLRARIQDLDRVVITSPHMGTFHPFPRLPAELRLRVWELTVEPRTVKVEFRGRTEGSRWFEVLHSTTPIPGSLQTCRESRNAGLYQRCFSELCAHNGDTKKKRRRNGDWQPGQRSYVWCNLDIDMIDIDDCWFDKFRSVAHLIKRLKFKREMTEFWRSGATQSADSDNLDWFENATEIHVVLGGNVLGGKDDFECWHGTSYEDSWPCDNVLFIDEKEGEEMWMMDLEYKCDRAAEVWNRQKWGWKLFYCCGELLNNVDEEGVDCRASLHHRSLYRYSLS